MHLPACRKHCHWPLPYAIVPDSGCCWLPSLSVAGGKIYFEVEVVRAEGGVYVGLAGSNFRANDVGGDGASWGLVSFGYTIHRRV